MEKGKIFYKSETSDINEIDEEDADGEQIMEIAHKNDLDLGKPSCSDSLHPIYRMSMIGS